ncbi:hypothetical protein ACROYT_G009054 [Oculina patagonica]
MAGFVRWIAVLLAVVAVFEENAANPIELIANQEDAIENSEDPAFGVDNRELDENAIPEHDPQIGYRCGGLNYNQRTHMCCFGRVLPRGSSCQPICGSVSFNPYTHKCCFGKILRPKWSPCRPGCGFVNYNPLNYTCCYGRVISRYSVCQRLRPWCGSVNYNPLNYSCCYGRLIPSGSNCQPMCGSVSFNPLTHKCCFGTVIRPKFTPCRPWRG